VDEQPRPPESQSPAHQEPLHPQSVEAHGKSPLRHRPRVTATAVGAAATSIAALAGLLTTLKGWFPDGEPNTSAPGLSTQATTTPPTLDRLIYSDSLLEPGVFAEEEQTSCRQAFTEVGYRIEVRSEFQYCDDSAASAALSGLRSARIEVTVVWTAIPSGTYRNFGAGDATLRCRGERETGQATGYLAGLTSSGAWSIDRYENGEQINLSNGRDASLDPTQGDAQRLRLDCLQLESGDVRLLLYVDDARIAGYTDASPAPPGVIGLAAASFTKDPFAVTFRDLRVYGSS
jgi:hypothetical protein